MLNKGSRDNVNIGKIKINSETLQINAAPAYGRISVKVEGENGLVWDAIIKPFGQEDTQ